MQGLQALAEGLIGNSEHTLQKALLDADLRQVYIFVAVLGWTCSGCPCWGRIGKAGS